MSAILQQKKQSPDDDVWWAVWEVGKRGHRYFLGRVNGYRKVAHARAWQKWPNPMNDKLELDLLRDDVMRDKYGRIIFTTISA